MREIKLKFPSFYQLWQFRKESQLYYCEVDPLDCHITSVCDQQQIELAVNKYQGQIVMEEQTQKRVRISK